MEGSVPSLEKSVDPLSDMVDWIPQLSNSVGHAKIVYQDIWAMSFEATAHLSPPDEALISHIDKQLALMFG